LSVDPEVQNIATTFDKAKLRAYVKLAKFDIKDYYFGLLVVLSLLPAGERSDPRSLLTLAVFLVHEICVVAACVSFDDVTGWGDGSDATNYGSDAPARRLARKPLLTGALTPREATRFGWLALAGAIVSLGAVVAIAPHRSPAAIVITTLTMVFFVQWSWGLKLSYHLMGEVLLVGLGVGWVLGPEGLLTGRFQELAIVESVLFGLGPLLFGVFGNTNDIEGDAKANRRTVASTFSARTNRIFIVGLSALEALLILGAAVTRVAPWWFPLAMLPAFGMRVHQLVTGVKRGDTLAARKIGIKTHRLATALLILVNLLIPVVGGTIK